VWWSATNVDGETEIAGLYAVGEVACTVLHGPSGWPATPAERWCSDHRAAEKRLRATTACRSAGSIWHSGNADNPDETVVVSHNWDEITPHDVGLTWGLCGQTKDCNARKSDPKPAGEIQELLLDFIVTSDLLELRNIATVAELIVMSALQRRRAED
jgi:L-aspartate oxidase